MIVRLYFNKKIIFFFIAVSLFGLYQPATLSKATQESTLTDLFSQAITYLYEHIKKIKFIFKGNLKQVINAFGLAKYALAKEKIEKKNPFKKSIKNRFLPKKNYLISVKHGSSLSIAPSFWARR